MTSEAADSLSVRRAWLKRPTAGRDESAPFRSVGLGFLVFFGLWLILLMAPAGGEENSRIKVAMLGDSLTQGGRWRDYFPDYKVLNFGVGGDSTIMILERLDALIAAQPDVVFIQAGINDFAAKVKPATILKNHNLIWERLR